MPVKGPDGEWFGRKPRSLGSPVKKNSRRGQGKVERKGSMADVGSGLSVLLCEDVCGGAGRGQGSIGREKEGRRKHICDEQIGKSFLKLKASLSARQISSLFYLFSKLNILCITMAQNAISVLLEQLRRKWPVLIISD